MEEATKQGRSQTRAGGIRFRWFLLALAIVILIAFAAWTWESWQCNKSLRAQASQSARNVAHVIAVFGSNQIVSGNWEALQDYANDLVREEPLAYVAIVNPTGIAVVHTDASLKGKPYPQAKDTSSVVNASVPVMRYTRQVAEVRVGVSIPER
jgi:sensor histidine kinase regulating citrate/malate metabolism